MEILSIVLFMFIQTIFFFVLFFIKKIIVVWRCWHDQQIKNTQYKPNIQFINEGWGLMFGQARQQIRDLTRENKKNCTQLREMSYNLTETQAINEQIQWNLQDTEEKQPGATSKTWWSAGKKFFKRRTNTPAYYRADERKQEKVCWIKTSVRWEGTSLKLLVWTYSIVSEKLR